MASSKPERRSVESAIQVQPHGQSGIKIYQPIGPDRPFMPFLLLDDLESRGAQAGFGDHPHRGQETMTYILEGQLMHQDSNGGKGLLSVGDMQIMSAGKGIMHSETSISDPITNCSRGIQLWVALPAARIAEKSTYRDIIARDMPIAHPSPGVSVTVIVGDSFEKTVNQVTKSPVWYLDVRLEADTSIDHPVPPAFNCFVHVLEGSPHICGQASRAHGTVFLRRDGDVVNLENRSGTSARTLLIAGDPLDGQEVVQRGPFVATSQQGIRNAYSDYQTESNGFEGVHAWKSDRVHSRESLR